MAEFVEVMGIKRRMCKYYDDCPDGCPLDNTNFCVLSEESLSEEDFKEAETIMLNWNKKHPVIFPTWIEWLKALVLFLIWLVVLLNATMTIIS